ncbi:SGNH/GDSL hydrolase family protein [Aurantiacibacter luteus]|uniref:SGNH hydrolase-type esterase domain-containing protein n=1 Tax=Aurantiacibacter luteus TaxID=1581420 RepID=A0A0G9MWS0_9SPHN|nr:SGNH/GDSL hydrolase family protein [Aurantiacibacter luteus]KLE35222.1 hypothetical protein AAW00_01715 [Aurantiacibacter luteus]
MMRRFRFWIGLLGWAIVLLGASLLAVSAWAIAPFSSRPGHVLHTAGYLLRAPLADRMAIGDSRIWTASPPEGALFAAYGGASAREMSRVVGLLCNLHSGPVTIALGVNDTKPHRMNLPASAASLAMMTRDCERPTLALARIWPVEPGVDRHADSPDPVSIDTLNLSIDAIAERSGIRVLAVPDLPSPFTRDGVHFTDEVTADYAHELTRWTD